MKTRLALTIAGVGVALSLVALTARPASAQAAPPTPSIVSVTETGPNSGTVTFSFPPDAVLVFPVTSREVRRIQVVADNRVRFSVDGKGGGLVGGGWIMDFDVLSGGPNDTPRICRIENLSRRGTVVDTGGETLIVRVSIDLR